MMRVVRYGWHRRLAATRRWDNIDAGATQEIARIVKQIRARWPRVRILLRGNSGFCRQEPVRLIRPGQPRRLSVRSGGQFAAGRPVWSRTGPSRGGGAAEPASRRGGSRASFTRRAKDLVAEPAGGRQGGMDQRRGQSEVRRHHAEAYRASGGVNFTRRSIARAATWRTGSKKNRKPTCSPTAHPRRPSWRTNCASGSLRSPMSSSAPCAASALRHTQFAEGHPRA